MSEFSADFIVSAVTQFVEDAAGGVPGRDKPLTDLNKLDSLVAELEKQLYDKKRTESAVTVASALPVLTSNTKELMNTLERAKQLVKQNSRCVAAQLGPGRKSADVTSPRKTRERCDHCDKLLARLEAVEVENQRLREMVAARESTTGGSHTAISEWQPARMLRTDAVDELEELEAALNAVESLKIRFDRFTTN